MNRVVGVSTRSATQAASDQDTQEGLANSLMALQRSEEFHDHSDGGVAGARHGERTAQSTHISRLPTFLQQPADFLGSLSRVLSRRSSPYDDPVPRVKESFHLSTRQDAEESVLSEEASTRSVQQAHPTAQEVPHSSPFSRSSPSLGSSAGPPLVALAVGSTLWWGWRSVRTLEKELERRYADIAYQIRRPDALSNRIVAFKYLVGGGLAIPLAALGACALLSYNKTTSQGPLQSRQPPMISAHGRDQQSDDAPSVAVSAAPPHDLVLRAGIPSGTLRDGQLLPVRWHFAVKDKLSLFSQGFRDFVSGVMPEREAWQRWASAARRSQADTLRPPASPFRGGSPD